MMLVINTGAAEMLPFFCTFTVSLLRKPIKHTIIIAVYHSATYLLKVNLFWFI